MNSVLAMQIAKLPPPCPIDFFRRSLSILHPQPLKMTLPLTSELSSKVRSCNMHQQHRIDGGSNNMHPPTHSNSSAKNSAVPNDDDRQANCETGEVPKDVIQGAANGRERGAAVKVVAERSAIYRSPGLGRSKTRYLMLSSSSSSNGVCDARTTRNNNYRNSSSWRSLLLQFPLEID